MQQSLFLVLVGAFCHGLVSHSKSTFHFCCEFCHFWDPLFYQGDIDCGWHQFPGILRGTQLTFCQLLWPQWTEIPPLMSCLGFSHQEGQVGFCCLQAHMLQRHGEYSRCSLCLYCSQGIWQRIYWRWPDLVSEHQSFVWSCPGLDAFCEVARKWHSVFLSNSKILIAVITPSMELLVREPPTFLVRSFLSMFLATFKQLYDHIFAFEFCCFGIIFPAGKKVTPLFARSYRRYGQSPYCLDLSCCLCSGLTSSLHVCRSSGPYEIQCHLLHVLSHIHIRGMGIYVLALCVFLVATFPHSWVLLWHINRKTMIAVKARRSISLFIVWFSMKGDSCTGFFTVTSSRLR